VKRLRLRAAALASIALSVCVTAATGQTLTFTQVGSIPGPVDLIEVQGQFAYVAANKNLLVFDVSNPAAPRKVGDLAFPEKIWGFRVNGSRVFVADGHSGLGVVDVSKPSAPVLVSLFKTPGQAKNASVAGDRALVANHMSGVDVVDISNAAKPSLVGSAYLDGYARDVATAGSLAIAVDNPSGVYVFDMAGSNPLEPVTTLQNATAPQQVEVVEISSAQKRIAVLSGNEPYDPLRTATMLKTGAGPRPGSIQLYDVSNPTAPALAGRFPTSGGARRVAVKGTLVYVADGPEGLQVMDISTPSKPTPVGTFKTAQPARDVAVGDSLVFVIAGAGRQALTAATDGDVLILRQTP